MTETYNSLTRVLTALSHREPDRVPFLLCATMHGAKELGLTPREYFSRAEYIVQGQMRLREKYRADSVSAFCYAAIEMEAWGSETIFYPDGPPNAGAPIIRKSEDIERLQPPRVSECASLKRILEATQVLKSRVADGALLLGVAISPFSLPIMQMGFDRYIELIYDQPALLDRLLKINQEFCVEWANAQFAAGASAVVYFDPVSSTTIVPKDISVKIGLATAKRVIARFKGPAVIHFASGRCLPILKRVASTGTVAVGVSALEDLVELKRVCGQKISVVGNLNAIEMRRWTPS
jgi:uroporphyrinogen decarboxylase